MWVFIDWQFILTNRATESEVAEATSLEISLLLVCTSSWAQRYELVDMLQANHEQCTTSKKRVLNGPESIESIAIYSFYSLLYQLNLLRQLKRTLEDSKQFGLGG